MELNKTMRIVLLGKTGSGKSSLANTICGEKGKFKESASPSSETKECCGKTTKINGRNICVIDTPGLFDTDLNSTDLSPQILKCIKECAPGPHAFLIVLQVERYTQQEQAVVDIILTRFSEEALKYTTVVFTHGEQLNGMKIEDWVSENTALRILVQKCGGRCHVFDNWYWNNSQDQYKNNQYQVGELLNTIIHTLRENNGTYYINKFLQFVINNVKRMRSKTTYAAKILLGALLGKEEFAKDLLKKKLSTDEDATLCQQVQEMDKLKIVLLGKKESGKSSLADTIFGDEELSEVNHGQQPSKLCQYKTGRVNGRIIQVMDTPGFFNTDPTSTELNPEILKVIREVDSAPGHHAFLLVLKVERFTTQEQAAVDLILKHLSEKALKHTTVVFTHGDYLPNVMKIEEWVKVNKALNERVEKCGGRCHVFDNKYWNNSQDPYRNNQLQIRELLKSIDRTVEDNRGTRESGFQISFTAKCDQVNFIKL